ncbi:hypothetical protein EBZ35_02355 [bacterium]|nr:hypothetical protein [bacterium]
MINKKWWLSMGMAVMCGVQAVSAYELVFSSVNFNPAERKNSISILVKNDSEKPQAVEFSIKGIEMDAAYNETHTDLPETLFKVSPSGIIVEPGSEELVKITWNGKKEIAKEIPFRVIAKELDIEEPAKDTDKAKEENSKDTKLSVKTLFNQIRFISVLPDKAETKVAVMATKVMASDAGKMTKVTLKNMGTVKYPVENKSIMVVSKSDPSSMVRLPLSTFSLFPDFNRTVEVPLPATFVGDEVAVSLVDNPAPVNASVQ